MTGCSMEGSTPNWGCDKQGIRGWLCLPCPLVPHGHGVPAARVLPALPVPPVPRHAMVPLARPWLRRGRDGSLPCLR